MRGTNVQNAGFTNVANAQIGGPRSPARGWFDKRERGGRSWGGNSGCEMKGLVDLIVQRTRLGAQGVLVYQVGDGRPARGRRISWVGGDLSIKSRSP
eukprot:6813009-Pyramimonas_sp.AAC.1